MTYRLKFLPKAWKEWNKIAPPIRAQFKKKLEERLVHPRVIGDKLTGYENVYKIKLRTAGYRLAYEVLEGEVVVYVLVVGKREKKKIYNKLKQRR